jgi:CHAT domain-containing protein
LAPDAAAVTYLRCTLRFDRDPVTGETPPPLDALLAFVVRHGGAVTRIDLGPAGELEELVRNWRIALGRALDGRGIGAPESGGEAGSSETLGGRIRERALDPILDLAGEIRTLHVVPDDLLHLIPLDALPLGSGLVGERMDVRNEVTLARLLQPEDPAELGGSLTIAGAIDYDAEADEDASSCPPASTPPVGIRTERSLRGMQGFGFLPGSGAETESIAALYREAFERVAIPLAGSMATKSALRAAAPDTRYFHLATHGWFASEVFRSQLDSLGEDEARKGWLGAEETLTGFAPETLCGLALAGANRGRDAVGRVPGILTAEELASFDLRGCELAVLSACETHVGIRRAGQGIQSLQTALHAAGVRTAITSLWRVDDAATRRLFELFYSKLWKEKLGKADALWEAKMALRAEGHPLRDWAGWVLSGEPD